MGFAEAYNDIFEECISKYTVVFTGHRVEGEKCITNCEIIRILMLLINYMVM